MRPCASAAIGDSRNYFHCSQWTNVLTVRASGDRAEGFNRATASLESVRNRHPTMLQVQAGGCASIPRRKWWTLFETSRPHTKRRTGMVNEAEGYRNEQVALALRQRQGTSSKRQRLHGGPNQSCRAGCEAASAPGRTGLPDRARSRWRRRLYLETMEQVSAAAKRN